jgi:hypothetical protein
VHYTSRRDSLAVQQNGVNETLLQDCHILRNTFIESLLLHTASEYNTRTRSEQVKAKAKAKSILLDWVGMESIGFVSNRHAHCYIPTMG